MSISTSSSQFRLIAVLLIIALVLTTVFVTLWSQQRSQTPSPAAEFEKKISDTPDTPTEPEMVTTYIGQIKKIDQKNNSLLLVTLYGEKQVQFDQKTIIKQITTSKENMGPPPLDPSATDLSQPTVAQLSAADLAEGQTVQVASLTNIRAVSKFKVSAITIIK